VEKLPKIKLTFEEFTIGWVPYSELSSLKYIRKHITSKQIIYFKMYDISFEYPYNFIANKIIQIQKGFGMNFLLLNQLVFRVGYWRISNFPYISLFQKIL